MTCPAQTISFWRGVVPMSFGIKILVVIIALTVLLMMVGRSLFTGQPETDQGELREVVGADGKVYMVRGKSVSTEERMKPQINTTPAPDSAPPRRTPATSPVRTQP